MERGIRGGKKSIRPFPLVAESVSEQAAAAVAGGVGPRAQQLVMDNHATPGRPTAQTRTTHTHARHTYVYGIPTAQKATWPHMYAC